MEGKIEGTKRRKRRRKQLPDGLKEKRRSWNLETGAPVALSRELALKETMDLS
jgi:hypothetical protein